MPRKALLIRCSTDEAERVRSEAQRTHSKINSYVLNVALRAVQVEDQLFSTLNVYRSPDRIFSQPSQASRCQDPLSLRTALLVRCSDEEAARVREAAQRRRTTISAFVLRSLKLAWGIDTLHPVAQVEVTAPLSVH
jgi:uncharacterized protein (DUF1778 family)